MASDITASSTFNTTNMKPANDEVIPALWGQNVGDNLGYLYFRKRHAVNWSQYAQSVIPEAGTTFFSKNIPYNYLTGTLTGETTADTNPVLSIYVNGVLGTAIAPAITGGGEYRFKEGFAIDTSGLTDETDYEIAFNWAALSGERMYYAIVAWEQKI